MRLIDADTLMEYVKGLMIYWVDGSGFYVGKTKFPEGVFDPVDVISAIANAHTIDAVPAVRCKDCRHCEIVDETQRYFCRRPLGSIGYIPVKPHDFCSYGEAR